MKGAMQLACIQLNKSFPNYLECCGFILDNPDIALFVPRGYATGYLCVEDNTEVLYLSDNDYNPKAERGIKWNDPTVTINWETTKPLLSTKDSQWPDYKL